MSDADSKGDNFILIKFYSILRVEYFILLRFMGMGYS